ncbi:MAG: methanogenesis marker 16 metalloprotein [Methanoregula sp.]|jgi:putative methanogenesis marker 16 metalloprotein|nr:methanogenesis marker 16 metalloprotein [Methanoregula sp.]
MTKTIDDINKKIAQGTAVVFTAAEFKRRIADGEMITAADVDVVTTGTFGVMSGTFAVMHILVAPPGSFRQAENVWLNGVPAIPGPCPNEGLGSVDLIVYGTSQAGRTYGGGHLFRDLVEGKEVNVEVESAGKRFSRMVTLADMGLARLMTTRSAFKNYLAVVNTGPDPVRTIFAVNGLAGPYTGATVSGCGDINPLQNDPGMNVIGVGTRLLLNGGVGYIMGTGTRSTPQKPNISAFADMKFMVPEMMGGFVTSLGPECMTSVAIPVPVLDDAILNSLLVTNDRIPLPVADVRDRVPFASATYADVWDGTDPVITFSPESCLRCKTCAAAAVCPTGALDPEQGIDTLLCVNCGACVRECVGGACSGNLGCLSFDNRNIPVILRQSDRARALRLCEELKKRILERRFMLTEKTEDLV